MPFKGTCTAAKDSRPKGPKSSSPVVKAKPVDALKSDGLAVGHNLPPGRAERRPAFLNGPAAGRRGWRGGCNADLAGVTCSAETGCLEGTLC